MNLATEIAGCFGLGMAIESLPKSATTVVMVGLSCGSSYTHKNPICMHLTIYDVEHDSIKKLSTNSSTLSSHHNLHAYQFRFRIKLYFIYAIHISLSNSNSRRKKLTYICKKYLGMFCKVKATILFPTNNLKQDYTKAEDI